MTPMELAASIAAQYPELVRSLSQLSEVEREKRIESLIAEANRHGHTDASYDYAKIRRYLEIRTRMTA